jgi:hypothetical protein
VRQILADLDDEEVSVGTAVANSTVVVGESIVKRLTKFASTFYDVVTTRRQNL